MAQKSIDNWLSLAEYIESRYTEDIQELAKTLTETKASTILESTRELLGWIKLKL